MLEFKKVSIAYHRKKIISDLSLNIPEGKITTIIGPNGCGKTTLLQSLNGSAKVMSGEVMINHKNVLQLSSTERARLIAYLPQIRNQIPAISVRTLVEHGRFPYMGFTRRASREDQDKIQQAMEYTDVEQYAEQPLDTLSGGIRQRVFLAMILAQDSQYIVLDEPTTFLDIKAQRELLHLVKKMKEEGKTIILVLHDLHQAMDIADQVILMQDKEIVFQGTTEECIESGMVESVFEVRSYSTVVEGVEKYYFE